MKAIDTSIHMVKTKTKNGKDILKGFFAYKGYATLKLVGFKSAKYDNLWVLSEDLGKEQEGLGPFFFYEHTITKDGREQKVLACKDFKIYDMTIPFKGWLANEPVFDKYSKECFTVNFYFDRETVDYYENQYSGDKPKTFVVDNPSVELDLEGLKTLEEGKYKEFIGAKDTWFKNKLAGVPKETTGVGF
jgi:hypothetical protein